MVNVAAWLPLDPDGGVNVMLMTHDAFAATVAPLVQVVPAATAKSAAFAPEIDGAAVMFRLAFPVFVTVTTCTVLVVVTSSPPAATVEGATLATGAAATAVPVMPSVCGLPAALSVIDRVADRAPAALGVNVMLITHVAFGATAAPFVQVVPAAMAKSAALVPEIAAAAVMFRLALPVFLTVTACAALVVLTVWLVNTRAEGATVATGAVATPVPVRPIVCGLPVALFAIVSVADRAPEALGVNVMLIMQLPLGATGLLVVQVVPLATTNSVLPVEGADVNVRLPVPLFVTVTLCAPLVVPTGCEVAKFRVVVGLSTTVGDVPVPLRATVWVQAAGVLVPLLYV